MGSNIFLCFVPVQNSIQINILRVKSTSQIGNFELSQNLKSYARLQVEKYFIEIL